MGAFSGFIKAAADKAASGVESMASSIGSAFSSTAPEASAAGRWMASGSIAAGRDIGRAAKQTYQRPLVSAGPVTLLPSLESTVNSVRKAVRNPSGSNVGDAALNTANMALLGRGEGGVGVFEAIGKMGGVASDAGKFTPKFARDAGQVFMDNRANATKLATNAGETGSAATKAVRTAKQLVDADTGMIMTKGERAASGLVQAVAEPVASAVKVENATNAGAAAASGAADAAKSAASATVNEAPSAPGRLGRFASYAAKKGIGVVKSPVTGAVDAAKSYASAGNDVIQAVTHPQLLSRPLSAPVRAAGTAAKVAGKVTMGTFHAIPTLATVAGGAAVAADLRRPSMNDSADGEMAKNMGMTTEDYRGIRAVQQQKGQAGLDALVSGLAKAKQSGYLVEHAASRTGSIVSKIAAKKKAQEILKSSVKSAADSQINISSFGK